MMDAASSFMLSAYMDAVNKHADAVSVLHNHFMAGTRPPEADVQRAADARVIMVGARAAYLEVPRI